MRRGEVCRAGIALLVVWLYFLGYVYLMRAGAEVLARERGWGMSSTLITAFYLLGFGIIIVGAFGDIAMCCLRRMILRYLTLDASFAMVLERVSFVFAVVAFIVAGSIVCQDPTSAWQTYQTYVDLIALGDVVHVRCPDAPHRSGRPTTLSLPHANTTGGGAGGSVAPDATSPALFVVLAGLGWTLALDEASVVRVPSTGDNATAEYFHVAPVVNTVGSCVFDPPVYGACLATTRTPTLSECGWWISSSNKSNISLLQLAESTVFTPTQRELFFNASRPGTDPSYVYDYTAPSYDYITATIYLVDAQRHDVILRLLLAWTAITVPFLMYGLLILRVEPAPSPRPAVYQHQSFLSLLSDNSPDPDAADLDPGAPATIPPGSPASRESAIP